MPRNRASINVARFEGKRSFCLGNNVLIYSIYAYISFSFLFERA